MRVTLTDNIQKHDGEVPSVRASKLCLLGSGDGNIAATLLDGPFFFPPSLMHITAWLALCCMSLFPVATLFAGLTS